MPTSSEIAWICLELDPVQITKKSANEVIPVRSRTLMSGACLASAARTAISQVGVSTWISAVGFGSLLARQYSCPNRTRHSGIRLRLVHPSASSDNCLTPVTPPPSSAPNHYHDKIDLHAFSSRLDVRRVRNLCVCTGRRPARSIARQGRNRTPALPGRRWRGPPRATRSGGGGHRRCRGRRAAPPHRLRQRTLRGSGRRNARSEEHTSE